MRRPLISLDLPKVARDQSSSVAIEESRWRSCPFLRGKSGMFAKWGSCRSYWSKFDQQQKPKGTVSCHGKLWYGYNFLQGDAMKRAMSSIVIGLLIFAAGLSAQEGIQKAKVKKIDLDKLTVTLTVGDKDRTFNLDEQT